jgi:adenylate cyclase
MELPGVERRLAAILAADVVGYSRLMEADEAGTHARLKALRNGLLDPAIARHKGRIVKVTGDGALVEFPSAVGAVLAAAEIQRAVAERETKRSADERIAFRIGINLGDVIIEDDDIYGDGVNVAARLEGLAEPGGICVARNVYNQVKAKVDFGFASAGAHRVKNISEPVSVYRAVLDGARWRPLRRSLLSRSHGMIAAVTVTVLLVASVGAIAWHQPWRAAPQEVAPVQDDASWNLPSKPSIAVLPFANLNNDPDQDLFIDGLTNDIITDLSKFSPLFVIAANSTFQYKGKAVKVEDVARDLGVRYVLEGSVQRSGDTLRINAQLIDAPGGHHVWAERYDRKADDFFAVQKELTERIAGIIGSVQGARRQAELERIAHTPTKSLTAYDFFLRGVLHRSRETREDSILARAALEKAIELDPQYARAIAELSATYLDDISGDWSESREHALQQAETLARRAIEIDGTEPKGYIALGFVYQLKAQNDKAIPLMRKALDLNPNDYMIHKALGYTLAYAGAPEEGIYLLEKAERINPYHPGELLRSLGQAHFFGRKYEEAVEALNKITQRHRTSIWLYTAASHAQLGQTEEAHAAIAEALKLKPDLNLEHEIGRRLENGLARDNAEHLRAALRKAGLPEKPPVLEP